LAADHLGLEQADDRLGHRVKRESPTEPIEGLAPASASR